MRFVEYLPDEFKETVSIYRINEVTRRKTDVASDVVCWIMPERTTSGNQVVVEDGVAIHYELFRGHLEKPNPNIQEGDHLEREGGNKLRVYSIRPYGDDVMQLILRARKVL